MAGVANSPEQIQQELARLGEIPASVEALADLYRRDKQLFFDLAVIGVSADAVLWQKELAREATKVGALVRHGFQVKNSSDGRCSLVSGPETFLFLVLMHSRK